MLFLFDCVTLIILLNLTFLEYNLVRNHALLSFADGEYVCGASSYLMKVRNHRYNAIFLFAEKLNYRRELFKGINIVLIINLI